MLLPLSETQFIQLVFALNVTHYITLSISSAGHTVDMECFIFDLPEIAITSEKQQKGWQANVWRRGTIFAAITQ